jgi:bidirectional [NiFe] hydrogenase diaphorase subunit
MPVLSSPEAAAHPSGDKRFAMLEATMRRHQYQHSALIEVLHAAQQLFGYLERDLLYYVAHRLKLPLSKVYGVASFYHLFRFKPAGAHICVICTGTACYVKGADDLLRVAQQKYQVQSGETTADGQLSLLTARCLGACGIAPAVVLDDVTYGQVHPEKLLSLLKGRLHGGPA